jgi:hypothetical protein
MSYREIISPSWCANTNVIPLPLACHPITAPTYVVLNALNNDLSHFIGDAQRIPQQFISLLVMVCMLLEKETGKYKLLTNYFPVINALHANMYTTI